MQVIMSGVLITCHPGVAHLGGIGSNAAYLPDWTAVDYLVGPSPSGPTVDRAVAMLCDDCRTDYKEPSNGRPED
jgi:hypothetical protein